MRRIKFINPFVKKNKKRRYVPYKASGMAYIRFAKEEKELFKLLFMRDRSGEQIKENPEEMEALIGLIAKQVNIDKEAARFFILKCGHTHTALRQ